MYPRVNELADKVRRDTDAAVRFAAEDPNVRVAQGVPVPPPPHSQDDLPASEASSGATTSFFLPADVRDGPDETPTPQYYPSVEIRLQRSFWESQRRIKVCARGARSGRDRSAVADKAITGGQGCNGCHDGVHRSQSNAEHLKGAARANNSGHDAHVLGPMLRDDVGDIETHPFYDLEAFGTNV